MKKKASKNPRQDSKETQNISKSSAINGSLRSGLSKRQEKRKANFFRSNISFAGLLRLKGRVLTAADKGFTCCCPFCGDLSCRFYIRENDSTATCFSCDWSGDVIDYVVKASDSCVAFALELLSQLPLTVYKPRGAEKFQFIAVGLGTTPINEPIPPRLAFSIIERVQGEDVDMYVSGAYTSDSMVGKAAAVAKKVARSLTIHDITNG